MNSKRRLFGVVTEWDLIEADDGEVTIKSEIKILSDIPTEAIQMMFQEEGVNESGLVVASVRDTRDDVWQKQHFSNLVNLEEPNLFRKIGIENQLVVSFALVKPLESNEINVWDKFVEKIQNKFSEMLG